MFIAEKIKDSYIEINYNTAIRRLKEFEAEFSSISKPVQVGDYPKHITVLTKYISLVKGCTLDLNITEIKHKIEETYSTSILERKEKENSINQKYDSMINSRVRQLEEKAKEHNQIVKEEFDKKNNVYIALERKRQELETYDSIILEQCAAYGVTTSDITINNSSFSTDELDQLLDQFLVYMKKTGNRSNVISSLRSKIESIEVQAIIIFGLLFIAFTPLLNLIAVLIFGFILQNKLNAKQKMKMFSLLLGLIYNIRPLGMGFKDSLNESLLDKEEIDEDNDSRLNDITEKWQQELELLDKDNPQKKLEEERLWLTKEATNIKKHIDELLIAFSREKESLLNVLVKLIEQRKEEFELAKSKIKLLGEVCSDSHVFNTRFRLGLKDGILEESKEIGLSNIIIQPSIDEKQMKTFLQVMLANALTNVRADMLTVIVYDPNKFGQDLVSFYQPELEMMLQFKNDKLDETITALREYAMKNMKDMRGKDINSYNKEAAEIGKTTKEYKLLVVLSQPKVVEENEALSEFMSYSAKLGVFVWLVTEKVLPNTYIFRKPFDTVLNPYSIELNTFGKKVSDTLIHAIETAKTDSLAWEDFVKNAIPDQVVWKGIGDRYIDLDPGFEDGDPTMYRGYTIGNEGDVHALGVGGTGSGKSVYLNHLIATACRKYSPRDFELWLFDFKRVEFSFYLPTDSFQYILPHLKACLCTTDGDYAASVYTALEEEMKRRNILFAEVNVKNLYEYNSLMRKRNEIEKILPRILLINDEFQVLFQAAEDKAIEIVKTCITQIAKLGRNAGVHLLLTSQSMKGTLSADVLQQFTLRFGLRCDKEVSMETMGTELSSSIKGKGYLYIRSLKDKTLKSQKLYRTPYVSNDTLRNNIKEFYTMAKQQKMPEKYVIMYDEATTHNISELDEFLDKMCRLGKAPESGLIVLGNRMAYSVSNKAPDNIVLTASNNTHIMSTFSETVDLVNFYKQMRCNISHFIKEAQVFVNSQIDDLHYLCELDLNVPEEQQELSGTKASLYDLFALFESIYQMRADNKIKDKPLYIILIGWDKAVGWGIDRDSQLTGPFATLLQLCGEYEMHFIFINTAQASIGSNIVEACKYKICGKVDEKSSWALLGTKQGCKTYQYVKNGYIYVRVGDDMARRDKLYLSEQKRKIKVNELVL